VYNSTQAADPGFYTEFPNALYGFCAKAAPSACAYNINWFYDTILYDPNVFSSFSSDYDHFIFYQIADGIYQISNVGTGYYVRYVTNF
jgi:hypothetical protein